MSLWRGVRIYVWGSRVTDRSRGLHAHIKGKRGEYGIMGEIRKAVVCVLRGREGSIFSR